MAGIAGPSPDELAEDLEPLFDMIVREVAPPTVQASNSLRPRLCTGRTSGGCMHAPCRVAAAAGDLRDPHLFLSSSRPSCALQMDAPLQLLVTNLDYDEHKGRIAIGRVQSGTVRKGDSIVFTKPGAAATAHRHAAPCRLGSSSLWLS